MGLPVCVAILGLIATLPAAPIRVALAAAPEPYEALHGGAFSGPAMPASPDPLVRYRWNLTALRDRRAYQSYADPSPLNVTGVPASSFANLASLLTPHPNVVVTAPGLICLEYGQETAAWVEVDVAEAAAMASGDLTMSISENRLFAPAVTGLAPRRYNTTFRLETTKELYDGVRFAWLNFTGASGRGAGERAPRVHSEEGAEGSAGGGPQGRRAAGFRALHLTGLRRVNQVVPTNYDGWFNSSDEELNRIWWTGAYTTKVTLQPNNLGSELMSRGDRIAFLGDAHVTQAIALAAFGNYELLDAALNSTKDIPNSIEPYWLMWVLSVCDFFAATGSKEALLRYGPWVEKRLQAGRDTLYPAAVREQAALRWSRDDPRLGFGFEFSDIPQAQFSYRALMIEAASRYGAALAAAGNASRGAEWSALAHNYTQEWHAEPGWPDALGMPAASDAINAGIVGAQHLPGIVARLYSDPLLLPSLSCFDSFFVLKALSAANATEQALYLTHRHFGGMIRAGATTTWERYDPQWADAGAVGWNQPPVNAMNDRTSMSHPWGGGATAWLTTHGCGVRPVTPGYATWEAVPTLLRVGGPHPVTSFEVAVPTPFGPIRLELDVLAGRGRVVVPAGTTASRILIPVFRAGNGSSTSAVPILLEPVPPQLLRPRVGEWAGSHAVYRDVPAGEFLLQFPAALAVPSGPAAPVPANARRQHRWHAANTNFIFPVQFLGLDTATSGQWVHRYGSQGYAIFNGTIDAAGAGSRDLVRLPPWAEGIYAPSHEPSTGAPPYEPLGRPACPPYHGYGKGTRHHQLQHQHPHRGERGSGPINSCVELFSGRGDDPRAPQQPSASHQGGERVAAVVRASRWGGSFHVGVEVARSGPAYNVTLYIADYEHYGCWEAIKTTDLFTGRTVAPMALLNASDTGAGVYVRYRAGAGQSLRFRVNQVHSAHDRAGYASPPMLSAVFLD